MVHDGTQCRLIPRLREANGGQVRIQVLIFVRIGDLTVRSYFAVDKSVPIPLILGTTCIDKNIRAAIPPERRIVPRDSRPVAILLKSPGSSSVESIDLDNVPRQFSQNEIENKFRVVRQVNLRPRTETMVTVRTDLPGISHVMHVNNAAMSTTLIPMHDIADIVPGDPFNIRIDNLDEHPVGLQNYQVVSQASPLVYFVLSDDGDVKIYSLRPNKLPTSCR